MCLASRMSTQANMGQFNSKKEIFMMIIGNVGLVQVTRCSSKKSALILKFFFLIQVQAIAAACVVSMFANVVSAIINGQFDYNDAFLLAASSVLTATISCFILGKFEFLQN